MTGKEGRGVSDRISLGVQEVGRNVGDTGLTEEGDRVRIGVDVPPVSLKVWV